MKTCVFCPYPIKCGDVFTTWAGWDLHVACGVGATMRCPTCGATRTYTELGHWIHAHGTVWCEPKGNA